MQMKQVAHTLQAGKAAKYFGQHILKSLVLCIDCSVLMCADTLC